MCQRRPAGEREHVDGLLIEQPPSRLERRDQLLDTALTVGQQVQHPAQVHHVESRRGPWVGADVVTPDLEVGCA